MGEKFSDDVCGAALSHGFVPQGAEVNKGLHFSPCDCSAGGRQSVWEAGTAALPPTTAHTRRLLLLRTACNIVLSILLFCAQTPALVFFREQLINSWSSYKKKKKKKTDFVIAGRNWYMKDNAVNLAKWKSNVHENVALN